MGWFEKHTYGRDVCVALIGQRGFGSNINTSLSCSAPFSLSFKLSPAPERFLFKNDQRQAAWPVVLPEFMSRDMCLFFVWRIQICKHTDKWPLCLLLKLPGPQTHISAIHFCLRLCCPKYTSQPHLLKEYDLQHHKTRAKRDATYDFSVFVSARKRNLPPIGLALRSSSDSRMFT